MIVISCHSALVDVYRDGSFNKLCCQQREDQRGSSEEERKRLCVSRRRRRGICPERGKSPNESTWSVFCCWLVGVRGEGGCEIKRVKQTIELQDFSPLSDFQSVLLPRPPSLHATILLLGSCSAVQTVSRQPAEEEWEGLFLCRHMGRRVEEWVFTINDT